MAQRYSQNTAFRTAIYSTLHAVERCWVDPDRIDAYLLNGSLAIVVGRTLGTRMHTV